MTHLIALGDAWSLWRWACLRATGFPVGLVLDLASEELAIAADELLAYEATAAHHRDRLIAACNAMVERGGAGVVQRALKLLRLQRVPEPIGDVAVEAIRQELEVAVARVAEVKPQLAAHYARASLATSQVLRQYGSDERFRQAMLWQNRTTVRSGVDALLRQPIDATDSKTRAKERLVASYAQRYAVKNDTIGFFGPCGWARFIDEPVALAQRPGPSLLATRTIFFEYWAIDALAAKLSEDPDLRPFMAPRLLPRFRLDGTTLHLPIERTAELPAEFAVVAARCDGLRTAREIADALLGDPAAGLADEAEVFAILDELVASKVVLWTFEIPTSGPYPERQLATLLAGVDDLAARDRALAVLAELHHAREAIAACTDAAELDTALAAFETTFTRATDAESQRAHGQTYAARTPLREECVRDLDVALGRPFLDRLAPPLELVLQSARWYTHEIAARYRRALIELYRRVRGDGDPVVDFARFWQAVPALFPGGATSGSIVGDVRAELRRRWTAILAIDPAERVVQRRADVLADAVHRAFAAPGPGWPAARHHSPDLLIAAMGPEAIAEGNYQIVLGELHTGFNTIAGPFLKLHPQPGELVVARDADIDRVCIAPVWSKAVTAVDYSSPSPRDLDLETAETRSARPREQVLAVGDLVVEAGGEGGLEVRTRDGAWRFDIIAFFEHHLIAESYGAFSPIDPTPWTPRVTIDDVVLARATWRVTPAELDWPAIEDAAARFVAARRWARSLGLPRWMFVKTPEEVKPVYVDFASPVYVELLAKQLRSGSAAALSEMLPSVEETWVRDASDARYIAELRIAALDPVPWKPEPIG